MAKWKKQSHVVYQCSYHMVWCPKHRFRILEGAVAKYVEERLFTGYAEGSAFRASSPIDSLFCGIISSSAFAAILVYAQELISGKVGMIAGLFYLIAELSDELHIAVCQDTKVHRSGFRRNGNSLLDLDEWHVYDCCLKPLRPSPQRFFAQALLAAPEHVLQLILDQPAYLGVAKERF